MSFCTPPWSGTTVLFLLALLPLTVSFRDTVHIEDDQVVWRHWWLWIIPVTTMRFGLDEAVVEIYCEDDADEPAGVCIKTHWPTPYYRLTDCFGASGSKAAMELQAALNSAIELAQKERR